MAEAVAYGPAEVDESHNSGKEGVLKLINDQFISGPTIIPAASFNKSSRCSMR